MTPPSPSGQSQDEPDKPPSPDPPWPKSPDRDPAPTSSATTQADPTLSTTAPVPPLPRDAPTARQSDATAPRRASARSEAHGAPTPKPTGTCRRFRDGVCESPRRTLCIYSGQGRGRCLVYSEALPPPSWPVLTWMDPGPREQPARACRCGAPLAKWRHYCDACRDASRRESDRLEHELWRLTRRKITDGPEIGPGSGS